MCDLKRAKIFAVAFFLVALIAALAAQSDAFPPFLAKARKFGAKDCTFCHVNPEGGPPWNERGKWLMAEKLRRGFAEVDVEWLTDYKPGAGGAARSSAAAGTSRLTDTDRQFLELEQQWMEAVVKRDREVLDRIMGEEFTLASAYSTGERTSKAQFMKNVLESVKAQEFTYHDSHADLYGDVAVFKTGVRSKYNFDKDDRSGDYLITDVWVKREGRWQVVCRHSSIPVKAAPKG